jgi:hypothetical protein
VSETYSFEHGMTVEEISGRWAKHGAALEEPHLRLPCSYRRYGGAAYHGMFWWEDLWPYRDLDAILIPELLQSVEEHGWTNPVHVLMGRGGAITVAEGNHRLVVARHLQAHVPVHFEFKKSLPAKQRGVVRRMQVAS